jgi:hypothetical protein
MSQRAEIRLKVMQKFMKGNLKQLKLFLCLSIMQCRRTGSGRQSQSKITPALEENAPSASRCDPFTAEYPLARRLGEISEPAVRVGKANVFCLS